MATGGGRATLFLYGQTGSGKTYTTEQLFERAAHHFFSASQATELSVECVEVMGRKCFDLSSRKECSVAQRPDGSLRLQGLEQLPARSSEQLKKLLRRMMASRTTESTGANEQSSRSHAIISIQVGGCSGQLTLVDCAGSEWSKDSATHCAKRRREGADINTSLHALKQCVRMYAERAKTGRGHMPFRDSLLTRLLAESFNQSTCRLSVLGCVSPASLDTEHTTSTMRTVMELSDTTSEECTVSTQPVKRFKPEAEKPA